MVTQVVSNGVFPKNTGLVSGALLKNDSAFSAQCLTRPTQPVTQLPPVQERSNTAFITFILFCLLRDILASLQ